MDCTLISRAAARPVGTAPLPAPRLRHYLPANSPPTSFYSLLKPPLLKATPNRYPLPFSFWVFQEFQGGFGRKRVIAKLRLLEMRTGDRILRARSGGGGNHISPPVSQ